jgi:hypothetical protein
VHVDPWPFDTDEIALQIPASRLPAKPFDNEAAYRQALSNAPAEVLVVHVRPK